MSCLYTIYPQAFKLVQTNASNIGYKGILKQIKERKEQISIVWCIANFQSDSLNQKFLLQFDCKDAKNILQKYVQNITLVCSKYYIKTNFC